MVSIREGRVRLLSARSAPGGTTPEPILLASACPATACAEEHVRFCLTFDRDGLFSRDSTKCQCSACYQALLWRNNLDDTVRQLQKIGWHSHDCFFLSLT